ncbi:MAG: hypothetical protein HYU63_03315 [Armatimonadetes bacterium]|nr:hypothetical protein [Armatimonadota bacterium]
MDYNNLDNLKTVLNRIQEIQAKIQNPKISGLNPPEISFEAIMRQEIADNFQTPASFNPLVFLNPLMNPNGVNDIESIAAIMPEKIVQYQGHEMQAQTASRFQRLEKLISEKFPGKKVSITSTTEGTHSDSNHALGKAVDFIVEGISKEESKIVENLCLQAGFKPYNEYIYGSAYKTGDHMHIDLV